LCRALLEQLDRKTFTALVLNPFLSEEDLLKSILHDFGVVSREELKRGQLTRLSKQDLIATLNDFLLSLLPLRAGALLIVDEAQHLPRQVLEQIRILSNLETDKEKLLQIVLVGQSNLNGLLAAPDLRQLAQRISIRYELAPLTREEVAAYTSHRIGIAGRPGAVTFAPAALDLIERYSGGIPRLINLICDRALLAGYADRANRIDARLVRRAAESLGLRRPGADLAGWARQRLAPVMGVTVAATVIAASSAALTYQIVQRSPVAAGPVAIAGAGPPSPERLTRLSLAMPAPDQRPAAIGSAYSVLIGSYPSEEEASAMTNRLRTLGHRAYHVPSDAASDRVSWDVLVGRFATKTEAAAAEVRLAPLVGN
jgi:general secretion pathway protein A